MQELESNTVNIVVRQGYILVYHTRQKERTAYTIPDRNSALHTPYQTETAHCIHHTRDKKRTAYTIPDRNSALHTQYQTVTAHCIHHTRQKQRTVYTIPDRHSALHTSYQTEIAHSIHHTRQTQRTAYTIPDRHNALNTRYKTDTTTTDICVSTSWNRVSTPGRCKSFFFPKYPDRLRDLPSSLSTQYRPLPQM